MDVEAVLLELDKAVSENRGPMVEGILMEGIHEAMEEGDNGALLQLLNELIGYYREVGRYEDSYSIAETIISLCDQMGLVGSIPYATSLLNIANAYRAGGRLEDSLFYYDKVEEIYRNTLKPDSMLMASFYNNKSLLLQEMGRLQDAVVSLKKALAIVEQSGETYEVAVTHANLANTYLGIVDWENSEKEADISKQLFDSIGVRDSHYAAMLYAKGVCHSNNGLKSEAGEALHTALQLVEESLGRTEFYYRILDELKRVEEHISSGLELCEMYYEELFKPSLEKELPDWVDKVAVGLVGRGSDCFGFDDEASRDHDWGPGLCIWVTKETYDQIGQKLEDIYNSLPGEYKGFKRGPIVSSHKRRGVFIIEDFYKELLGKWPITEADMYEIPDHAFATCINGRVFNDPEGQFSKIRSVFALGYPRRVLYRKIAQSAAMFSQCAQYNFPRMLKRGDEFTAQFMLHEGLKEAIKLVYYIEGKFPPHDKWLYTGMKQSEFGKEVAKYIDQRNVDAVGNVLAHTLYELGYISDVDDYLDHHTDELIQKWELEAKELDELADEVTRLEFTAFDKVNNEGGRASCQDDYYTFEIMRKSQYLTWTKEMLIQYLYDFKREMILGRNPIAEKYGRMMESTAPKEYEKIKSHFAVVSEEKKKIIEGIVSLQVSWMEEFANKYPKLGRRSRSIHSNEDFEYNTSYETYLRGEISTYSDKMLELYGRYIVAYANAGKNLSEEIMKHSISFYGYDSLENAELKA